MATLRGTRTGKLGKIASGTPIGTAIRNKIVGTTSDVLSAPTRAFYGYKRMKADSDFNTLKRAKSYNNAPDYNPNGSVTDAFKARSLARDVKDRLTK